MAVSLSPTMARYENDGIDGNVARGRLRGMGDVHAKAQANVFLNYDSGPFHVSTAVRQTLASRRGTSADLSVGYDLVAAHDDLLRAEVGFSYANRTQMQTFFGVTAEQSARSGNPVYMARAGVAGGGASLTWRHAFTPNWIGSLGAGVIHLRGAAADSPLTDKRNSAGAGVTIAYRF
jgi:outer membrane scaffolding protein for murein synthesis (MipA/OmpV family)